jgi:hypothetical protein
MEQLALNNSSKGGLAMNAMAVSALTKISNMTDHNSSLLRARRKWTVLLLLSGSLGMISGILGGAIGLANLMGLSSTVLSRLGTIFIAATLPLFFFVAHCLDRIGDANRASRLEYCRRHGLKEG